MGSKGIKGIVISKDGSKVNIKDSETFFRLSKEFHKTLAKTRTTLREYGTSNLLSVVQELGEMCIRDRSSMIQAAKGCRLKILMLLPKQPKSWLEL